MPKPYLQYKDYLVGRYGEPIYRVPIDLNLGCPNREADGSGGCTFCNARGSKAVQTLGKDSAEEQVVESIRFARERYGAKRFMAYIQAFSATFGERQQSMYLELLDAFDFVAISIGTRPDCFSQEAYDFLVELNKHIEVWVELGIQTVHDRTLQRINRGHDWASSERAIKKLNELGIKVAVHVILGLPGETGADFQKTADTLAVLPIDAVKIHNLHIEQDTTLAMEHAFSPLPLLMEHDFAEHLMGFIRRMPPNVPIMRLTTDTLDKELIAPTWHMAKGQFIDYVLHQMVCRDWRQGDLFSGASRPPDSAALKVIETDDGSVTFWNEDYKEHYHTPAGARLEAKEKYSVPSKLKERLVQGDVQLLDVCFGLGYNSLVAMNTAVGGGLTSPKLSITALEMDRRVVRAASKKIQPLDTDSFDWKTCLTELYDNQKSCITDHVFINMIWGDARYTLTKLKPKTYDLVFLDAFSTQRNSELWTVDFFRKLKAVMKPDAVLLTYCSAIPVRAGLLEAGFFVGETDPVGRKRSGTIATMRAEDCAIPLPNEELNMIHKTTRGLTYRDPHGIWTNKEILRNRQERIIQTKQEESFNH